MPARLFRCEIKNSGTGDIINVHSNLDHGDWSSGQRPWESANPIPPGQVKAFQAESNGILTGTEGFVTVVALVGDPPHAEFLKIYWDLPYFKFDSRDVGKGVTNLELHRFDPDADQGSSEFINRDQTPGALTVRALTSGAPTDLMDQIEGAPEVLAAGLASPIAALWGGINVPDHVFCFIDISNNGSATPDLKVPGFSNTKAVNPVPVALRGSTLDNWVGRWESDNITAAISQGSGGLDVFVEEKRATGTHLIQANGATIQRIEFNPATVPAGPAGGLSSRTTSGDKLKDKVHVDTTGTQGRIGRTFVGEQNTVFRGDHVDLPEDAAIEIYRLVIKTKTVGHALRYIRPTTARFSVTGGFDEFMYFRPQIG
ncbi:MAG TPA: hypothetical protein VFA65_16845 [Bryobacteraceae bacterium]|nr:hypothetical protein [Bryobacteraceae bacterium]